MVRRVALSWVLLCWLPWCAAAPAALSLDIDSNQVELGQGVTARLHYPDSLPAPSMAAIRSALRPEFAVDDEGVTRTGPHGFVHQFTLHPRHTGALTVPALHAGDLSTAPITIHVTPAREAGHDMQVRSNISTANPWVRQQVRVVMSFRSADPYFGLDVHTPKLPAFVVVDIPQQQHTTTINGVRYTVKTVGWLLYPLQDGSHSVQLPAIGYVRNGLTVRRFYPPDVALQVKALPPYVPPLLPVGKVSVHTSLEPAGWLRSGHLAYWNVDVHGPDVPADWLPPVLAQITSNRDMQVFPAESTRRDSPDASGVHGLAHHRIPLKPLSSGRLPLPSLRLQYFDPDSGRLVAVNYSPVRPITLSLPVILILVLTGTVLLGFIARVAWRWTRTCWRRHRLRHQAIAQLQSAQEPASLRAALTVFAQAEDWPSNATLGHWLDCWRQRYRAPAELSTALDQLGAAHYGTRPLPPDVQVHLLASLRRPRRVGKR